MSSLNQLITFKVVVKIRTLVSITNNLRLVCQSFNAGEFSLSFMTQLGDLLFQNCNFHEQLAVRLRLVQFGPQSHSRQTNRTLTARSSDFMTLMISDRAGLHSVLLPLLIKLTEWLFKPISAPLLNVQFNQI